MKNFPDAAFVKISGDISRMDAIELAEFARKSKRILEFGIGGSTYILHQNSKKGTYILHIENVGFWNEYIKKNLKDKVPCEYDSTEHYDFALINIPDNINENEDMDFNFIKECPLIGNGNFDFIFVDGIAPLRKLFMYQVWEYLNEYGVMMIHDSKTQWIANFVSDFIKDHYLEIDNIVFHKNNSNMINIIKSERRLYYDWNQIEKGNNRENIAMEKGFFDKL